MKDGGSGAAPAALVLLVCLLLLAPAAGLLFLFLPGRQARAHKQQSRYGACHFHECVLGTGPKHEPRGHAFPPLQLRAPSPAWGKNLGGTYTAGTSVPQYMHSTSAGERTPAFAHPQQPQHTPTRPGTTPASAWVSNDGIPEPGVAEMTSRVGTGVGSRRGLASHGFSNCTAAICLVFPSNSGDSAVLAAGAGVCTYGVCGAGVPSDRFPRKICWEGQVGMERAARWLVGLTLTAAVPLRDVTEQTEGKSRKPMRRQGALSSLSCVRPT